MFINRTNPIAETSFTDIEIHITIDVGGWRISIIWQDEGHTEDVAYLKTAHEAWREAFGLWRYERRLHPHAIVAIMY